MNNPSAFEILDHFQQVREQLDPGLFLLALLASLAASYAAAGFYRFFYDFHSDDFFCNRSKDLTDGSCSTK